MPIVEAVGCASSSLNARRKPLAKEIEKAMSEAVLQCRIEGITDDATTRARMLEARHLVVHGQRPVKKTLWQRWFKR